ncbi:hypothetical protein pEaSNUABM11_00235 [Erwinia phage pEa_SNUABM_11]|nr:hypothetical protein pEaSNUABM11_00235 [Erwinia phage pEa_SNUABM_11]
MKEYDVAVLYTDGSHTTAPMGSGAGIHGYLYNKADFKSERGYFADGIPEAVTPEEYQIIPQTEKLPKLPDGVVEWVNCTIPVPKDKFSDVGELVAFICAFDNAPFKAKKYVIHVDATYVLNTFTKWIDGWASKGWIRADGTPIANKKLIERIFEIKTDCKKNGITVKVVKIKGHSDRYGNDQADKQARQGSTMSATFENVEHRPFWSSEESLPTIELAGGSGVQIGAANLPAINTQKYHYLQVNEPHPMCTVKDQQWYYLFSGNHSKDKDDIVLLGKMVPDTMFSITMAKEPWENLYAIVNTHAKSAWEDTPVLKRFDPIAIVNGDFLRRKKFVEASKEGLPVAQMTFEANGNVWMYQDLAISRILRPALLSYRAIEFRDELTQMLKSALLKEPHIVMNDITDLLFDEKGKPNKEFYRSVDRSFEIKAKIPGTEQTIPIILSRGIDLPQRTDLNRIKEPTGRFYVCCWRPQERYVRYAVVYIGEEYNGLWIAYYAANRILPNEIK